MQPKQSAPRGPRAQDLVNLLPEGGGIIGQGGNGAGATGFSAGDVERDSSASSAERERRIYEAVLSTTPDLVYAFNLEHKFIYANQALLAMWGKRREDALGKTCLELGYELWHAQMHDREIDQVIATAQPIRGEVPFTGTNGRRIYEYIFAPVLDSNGIVVAVAGTTRDVTERQQAEQAVRLQAEQMSQADRAKDEFLATLSHELRNPLAPLRNSLALLRASAVVIPHTRRFWQVNHLVRLVEDLLEMSRITRVTFALRKERVDLATVIRNAIETSEHLINGSSHSLRVSLPDHPLWLDGDPVRLAQIVANLLNNAAKYTDNGGIISVTVTEHNNEAVIAVRDNGTGIEPARLPQMFSMFIRGDRSSGLGQGGLGIGLALSRQLAQMHGGTLEGFSEGLDKGSEFTIRLPLSMQQLPSTAVQVPAEGTEGSSPHRRVLIVDDNEDAADSLAMLLEHLGAEVRVAHNGVDALALLPSYQPSLVLLDIGMPGMDGYEVARQIRKRFAMPSMVLVALTGWGQDEDRRRVREAGFDQHLVKPAEVRALQALVAGTAAS